MTMPTLTPLSGDELPPNSIPAWRPKGGMARLLTLLGVVAAITALSTQLSPAFAETRVALVIGNEAYQNVPRLRNPANDANAVAAALKRSGFDTIMAIDLDQRGMEDAAISFARAARTADVALFYYSGHALQFNGVNYLAPVDTILKDEADLRRLTRVDQIVADLQQAKNLRILILDSCRDNPFAEQLRRAIGTTRAVAIGNGLAKIDAPQGMIMSYATQAGRTAADGAGDNSPYTTAFLKHIEKREEIGTIFREISEDVYETTQHKQLPELSLSIIGRFYLRGKADAEASTSPAPSSPARTPSSEFESAAAIDTAAGWDAFLKQHSEGIYADLARERKARIEKGKQAALLPLKPSLSFDEIRAAAERGDAAAQGNLGVMYRQGLGVAQDDAQAVAWFRRAAEQRYAAAQNDLGYMYANGRGVVRDDAQAIAWYRKAVEQGLANAQNNLGQMYADGRGVVKDDAQAVAWIRKAADQGLGEAQANLGIMYANGRGVAKDDGQAVAWSRKAAELGVAIAQVNLGVMYMAGQGVAQDDAQAVAWFRKAADQGLAHAQTNLGFMYEKGRGVMRDDAQAVAWYRKAAEQGNAVAQANLGVVYMIGQGIPRDDAQAVAWFRKAAEQGNAVAKDRLRLMHEQGRDAAKVALVAPPPPQNTATSTPPLASREADLRNYRAAADRGEAAAQFNLGMAYLNGAGIAQDSAQAVTWLRKAADQGYANAQYTLGNQHFGRGPLDDDIQGVAWYRKAAEQGHALAQYNLGEAYRQGRGIARDNAQAIAWYRKAADQGIVSAKDKLRQMQAQ